MGTPTEKLDKLVEAQRKQLEANREAAEKAAAEKALVTALVEEQNKAKQTKPS